MLTNNTFRGCQILRSLKLLMGAVSTEKTLIKDAATRDVKLIKTNFDFNF